MAQRNIDFGTFPDDPDADAIRTAFRKVQDNFSELFSGLEDQAVLSVNRTPGAGITVSNPTGNVVVSANIACVQVTTSTLAIGRDGSNGGGIAGGSTVLTSSSQTLVLDLPNDIANVDNININGSLSAQSNIISNNLTINSFLSGNVANFTGNISAANISANNVTVTSNVSAGNVSGTLLTGTLATAAQPNITSVGNLTVLTVTGDITANAFNGDGSNITNVIAVPGPIIENGNSKVEIPGEDDPVIVTVDDVQIANINSEGVDITGNLSATGNISAGNISGTLLQGTLTTAAQPNVTSVGTLTGLDVNGNIVAANITANTGTFTGNGAGLTDLEGANVTGTVANATHALTANTVVDAAQPNITSLGTLTSLDVTGNVSADNLLLTDSNLIGNVLSFSGNTIIRSETGQIRIVTDDGDSSFNWIFSGTDGSLLTPAGGNISAGGNVTAGNISATDITGTTLGGTLTTVTQPNITSVGTLTELDVTGNISAGNINGGNLISANFIQGDGFLLSNLTIGAGSFIENGNSEVQVDANADVRFTVSGTANVLVVKPGGANIDGYANVTGNVSAGNVSATDVTGTTLGGTLTTAAQPNVTSVGTLSSLTVVGESNLGPNSNVIITGGVSGAFLKTDGTGNLTWDTGTIEEAQGEDTQVIFNDGGSTYAGNSSLTYDKANENLSVGNSVLAGNVFANAGTVIGNLIGGTLTTNAQPNVTSVGTLTGLDVNGNIVAENITANTGTFTGNGAGLTELEGSNVTGTVANATHALTANTVTTNAQPNITSVGTLSSLIVSGNINTSNISATTVTATTIGGTLTSSAQPNITSVGTLDNLFISGNLVVDANITTSGILSGNGSGLHSLAGANVVGPVANATLANSANTATTASTVTTNAQPNITSVGTLTSLAVTGNINVSNVVATTLSGNLTTAAQPNITSVGTLISLAVTGNVSANNVTVSNYHIRSVQTGISANGTTQATATALSKELNVVSTVSGTAGVRLPVAVAGMVVNITNTSANTLRVYPASGGSINTLSTNAAFLQPSGATLQFIAPTTTQWYSVGATYA